MTVINALLHNICFEIKHTNSSNTQNNYKNNIASSGNKLAKDAVNEYTNQSPVIVYQSTAYSFIVLYSIKYDLFNLRDRNTGYSTMLHMAIYNRQTDLVHVRLD
jgi:hydrogenase maturation factor